MFLSYIKKYFPFVFALSILLIVYHSWITSGLITSGDFWPLSKAQYSFYSPFPYFWNSLLNTGLGGNNIYLLWNHFFLTLPIYFWGTFLQLPYEVVERLGYLFPLLLLSIYSPYVWSRYFFGKNNFIQVITFLIFSLNSYILMLIDGGQMGIAFGYLFSPIVLISFITIIDSSCKIKLSNVFRQSAIAGLALALQINFDLRIAYITLVCIVFYLLLFIFFFMSKEKIRIIKYLLLYFLIIPFGITFLLHCFWIIPMILFPVNLTEQLVEAYTSLQAVKFLSFAKLENTISLLHPNWPENIFGKVSFMKAEFLLLPILAFSSLFFITRNKNPKTKNYTLFFALLGLIGAFLAKGANEPFGGIYAWMFTHIPGFIMFRDSTKWYTLIALSYSILIPYSISHIFDWLKSRSQFSVLRFKFSNNSKMLNFQNFFIFLILSFMLFLIRPAFLGKLDGTLQHHVLPVEYNQLSNFLSEQPHFFRTLWIPQLQRFGYYSPNHPAINGLDFFQAKSLKDLVKKLQKPETAKLLREAGVKYVIVPFDSEGEIFLEDRKYSGKQYSITIEEIKKISWLKYHRAFGKVIIFLINNPKDQFWTTSKQMQIKSAYVNPAMHHVEVHNARKGDVLIFAENYDNKWTAITANKEIVTSKKYNDLFNSFILLKDGDYNLEIRYDITR